MTALVAAVLVAGAFVAISAPPRALRPSSRRARWGSPRMWPLAPIVRRWDERHDQHAFERALPEFLEAAAGHLRAGSSLRDAIVDGAPAPPSRVVPAFAALVDAASAGAPLVVAVEAWARDRSEPSTRLAAAALGLAASEGGAAARSLDAVAATLRDRAALTREVRASSAHARLSAAVVGGAPLVFAVLASSLDPRVLAFLCATPVGLGCLASGVALDALGLWWMRRIVEGVGL